MPGRENREDDFLTMQEEAVRRVREMQRRSQSYLGQEPPPPPAGVPPEDIPAPGGGKSDQAPPAEHSRKSSLLPFDIAGIKLDDEKALIGMLMYLLYKNEADMKLILALGYLLL